VSNTLALTRLPTDIKQEYLETGAAVPREIMIAIARQETTDAMRSLWRRVKLQQLSVRAFRKGDDSPQPTVTPASLVLRSARRLTRALKVELRAETLGAAEVARLERALVRAQRGIATALAALSGARSAPAATPTDATGSSTAPLSPAPAPLAAARGD
jgi:hypothetical protein